jgi:ABC-type amino acid transport substrate-binding protein
MSTTSKQTKKTNRTILAVIGVIVIAIAAGFLGAVFRGGGSAAASSASTEGAFLEEIKQRGELRVGIAIAAPMTAEQADGTLGGPNVLPLQNLAEQLGVEFKPVPADWNTIVAGLQADRYDFAAYLDATLERSLSIQFSEGVYTYQGVFVVPADSPYTTSEDLLTAGPIATAQGASYESALEELGYELLSIDKIPNALSAVKSGRVAGAFMDLPAAVDQAKADPAVKILVPDPVIYQIESGYGVPEDIDARSLQTINIAIENARNSGELTRAFEEVGLLEADNLGDLEKQ